MVLVAPPVDLIWERHNSRALAIVVTSVIFISLFLEVFDAIIGGTITCSSGAAASVADAGYFLSLISLLLIGCSNSSRVLTPRPLQVAIVLHFVVFILVSLDLPACGALRSAGPYGVLLATHGVVFWLLQTVVLLVAARALYERTYSGPTIIGTMLSSVVTPPPALSGPNAKGGEGDPSAPPLLNSPAQRIVGAVDDLVTEGEGAWEGVAVSLSGRRLTGKWYQIVPLRGLVGVVVAAVLCILFGQAMYLAGALFGEIITPSLSTALGTAGLVSTLVVLGALGRSVALLAELHTLQVNHVREGGGDAPTELGVAALCLPLWRGPLAGPAMYRPPRGYTADGAVDVHAHQVSNAVLYIPTAVATTLVAQAAIGGVVGGVSFVCLVAPSYALEVVLSSLLSIALTRGFRYCVFDRCLAKGRRVKHPRSYLWCDLLFGLIGVPAAAAEAGYRMLGIGLWALVASIGVEVPRVPAPCLDVGYNAFGGAVAASYSAVVVGEGEEGGGEGWQRA